MIGYYHVSKNDTKNNADFTLGHDTLSEDVTVNDINLNSFEIKSGLNSKFWIGDKYFHAVLCPLTDPGFPL